MIRLLFTLFAFSLLGTAQAEWIKLKHGQVRVKLPEQWQAMKDMLGMPLVVVGPMKESGRPTITITPTNIHDIGFKKELMQKDYPAYREGRLSWLKDMGGESVGIFPYQMEKWPHIPEVHHYGHSYVLNNIHYVEHSYYFTCEKQIYHVKSLYRAEEFKGEEAKIESVAKSFECKGEK
jgi:hypothetical protein